MVSLDELVVAAGNYVDRVVDLLLLTDVCKVPGNSLEINLTAIEQAVRSWSLEERTAAAKWAITQHIGASENDIEYVPCPPHVQLLR